MTRSILALLAFTCSMPALAADWQLITKQKEGSIFIDAQGIVATKDGFRKAWDKWEYAEEQPGFPDSSIKTFASSRHLAHYNCKERTFAVAQVVYLDAKGKSVGQINLEVTPASFSDVPPGSISEAQLDFVCKAKVRHAP
jgi:hypothetical protein